MTEKPDPLTPEEVRELDGYGKISGTTPLPKRAIELWERELLWGRVEPAAGEWVYAFGRPNPPIRS